MRWPSDIIDGMSAEAVHEGVSRAVKRAREGGGPTFAGDQNLPLQRVHSDQIRRNTEPRKK
jgi:hypothetical protein